MCFVLQTCLGLAFRVQHLPSNLALYFGSDFVLFATEGWHPALNSWHHPNIFGGIWSSWRCKMQNFTHYIPKVIHCLYKMSIWCYLWTRNTVIHDLYCLHHAWVHGGLGALLYGSRWKTGYFLQRQTLTIPPLPLCTPEYLQQILQI